MDEVKLKSLYDFATSNKLDVGSWDGFKETMQDPAKAKSFYDFATSNKLELGDYENFQSTLGLKKKDNLQAPSGQRTIISGSVMPESEIATSSPSVGLGGKSAPTETTVAPVAAQPIQQPVDVPQEIDESSTRKAIQIINERENLKRGSSYDPVTFTPPKPTIPQTDTRVKFAQPDLNLPKGTEFEKTVLPDFKKKEVAHTYASNGNFDVADQILNTVQDNKDGYTDLLKGNILWQKGDKQGAMAKFQKSEKQNPNNPELYQQKALLAKQMGDESNTIGNANKYLDLVVGEKGYDAAQGRATAYSLMGNEKDATYWQMTAHDIKEDEIKNQYAKTIQGLPDKVYEGMRVLTKPLEIPADMIASGAGKISDAMIAPNIITPANGGIPKTISGLIDLTFGALMATPSGVVFNSVLEAGNLVGANQLTDWAFAPVSKVLEMNGVDEAKLGEWTKLWIQVGNLVPFMLVAHAKGKSPKEAEQINAVADKLRNKEPLNAEEVKIVDETIASAVPQGATPSETGQLALPPHKSPIIGLLEARIDETIKDVRTTDEIKKFQSETTDPTYRIEVAGKSELVNSPEEVIAKIQENVDKGVSPESITVDIQNDIPGSKKVAKKVEDLLQPKVSEPPAEVKTAEPVQGEQVVEPITKVEPNEKANKEGEAQAEVLTTPEEAGGKPPAETGKNDIVEKRAEDISKQFKQELKDVTPETFPDFEKKWNDVSEKIIGKPKYKNDHQQTKKNNIASDINREIGNLKDEYSTLNEPVKTTLETEKKVIEKKPTKQAETKAEVTDKKKEFTEKHGVDFDKLDKEYEIALLDENKSNNPFVVALDKVTGEEHSNSRERDVKESDFAKIKLAQDLPSKLPHKNHKFRDVSGEIDVKPIPQKPKTVAKTPEEVAKTLNRIRGNDEIRVQMTGIHYNAEAKEMVATDAHKLIIIKDPSIKKTRTERPLTPDEIKKEKLTGEKIDNTIDAKYPDYQAVIPKSEDNPIKIKAPIQDFIDKIAGINRANKFVEGYLGGIKAKIKIGDFEYGFDPKIMDDVLTTLQENGVKDINLELSTPNRGVIITSNDNPNIKALIMPVLLKGERQSEIATRTIIDIPSTPEMVKMLAESDIKTINRNIKLTKESLSDKKIGVFDKKYLNEKLKEYESELAQKKSDIEKVDNPIQEKQDLQTVNEEIKNGTITEEQATGFVESDNKRIEKLEPVVEDIESKAESENEADLNEAIRQADAVIQGKNIEPNQKGEPNANGQQKSEKVPVGEQPEGSTGVRGQNPKGEETPGTQTQAQVPETKVREPKKKTKPPQEPAEPTTKEQKRAEKNEIADRLLDEGLSGLMTKLGGKKSLLPEDRTTIVTDLKKIVEGLTIKAGLTFNQAVERILEKLQGLKEYSDAEIREIREELYPKSDEVRDLAVLKRMLTSDKISSKTKTKFEKEGIESSVSHQDEAREIAKFVVDEYGIDEAITRAESGKYEGDVNSSIFAESLDRLARMDFLSDAEERNIAIRYAKAARSAGRFVSAINHFYKKSPLGMVLTENQMKSEIFEKWFGNKDRNYKEILDEMLKTEEGKELMKGKIDESKQAEVKSNRERRRKKIETIFDSAKLDTSNMYTTLPGLPQAVNLAIEGMKKATLAGESGLAVIEKAIKEISEKVGENWDKEKFRNYWQYKFAKEIDKTERKETPEEQRIATRIDQLENNIKDYQKKIAEKDYKFKDKKKETDDKINDLVKERDDLRKQYEQERAKSDEGIQRKKEQWLDRFSKRMTGLNDHQKEQVITRSMKKILENGGLEKEEFRKIIAEAVGLGEMTPEQTAHMKELVRKVNSVEEAEKAMLDNETRQSINDYKKAVTEHQIAARELGTILTRPSEVSNKIWSLMKLRTLGFVTLLKNPIWNLAYMPVRAGSNILLNAGDLTLNLGSMAANKVFGTKIIPQHRNILAANYGYWGKYAGGLKSSVKKLYTGLGEMDYFSTDSFVSPIRPVRAAKDLWAWHKGEKFLTKGQVFERILDATAYDAEGIARGLTLGDLSYRWGGEGAEIAQIGLQEFGLKKNTIQYELLQLKPKQESYRLYLKKGLSEADAMKRAEDVEKRVIKAGEEAVMQQDSYLNEVSKLIDRGLITKDVAGVKVLNGILKTVKNLSSPYVKIPGNIAWELYNLANPELALAQSAMWGGISTTHFIKGDKTAASIAYRKSTKWLAKAGMGYVIQGTIATLITAGLVESKDDNKNKKAQSGEKYYGKPNSLNVTGLRRYMSGGDPAKKDGDLLVDLSWLGIIGNLMNVHANTLSDEKRAKLKDDEFGYTQKLTSNLTNSTTEALTNGVFSGYGSMMKALSQGGGYFDSWAINAINLGENIVHPATFASLSKAQLPTETTYKADSFLAEVAENAKQRSSVVRSFAGFPKSRINMWGEPTVRDTSFWGVMNNWLGFKETDTNKFGIMLYQDYKKNENPDFFPPATPKTLKVNGKSLKLTASEQDDLDRMVGQQRKNKVSPFVYDMAEIVVIEDEDAVEKTYSGLNEKQKVKKLQKIYSKAYARALKDFRIVHPRFKTKQVPPEEMMDEEPQVNEEETDTIK